MQKPITEKIEIILRFVSYTLITGFTGSAILTYLACQAASPSAPLIVCWFAISTLNFCARYFAFVRIKSMSPERRAALTANAWRHTLFSGLVWGAASISFIPTLAANYQTAFVVVLFGLNITSIPLMSDARGIASLFLPTWLLTAIAFYLSSGSFAVPVAILFALGCVVLVAHIIQTTLSDLISIRVQRDRALQDERASREFQMSFFLSATHDFRQPLQAMGFEVFSMQRKGADLSSIAAQLQQRLDACDHLIEDAIWFAKTALGFQKLHDESIAAEEVLQSIWQTYSDQAGRKGIKLRIYRTRDSVVNVDRQVLLRILENLVSNAIRHTSSGGVLVSIRPRGGVCRVEVWDTGEGIPLRDQERIYDGFYQGSNPGRHGIGLMSVKRLCDRIGTKLQCRSRPGHGTVFRFNLPVGHHVDQHSTLQPSGEVANLTGRRIVLLEDDDAMRMSLAEILRSAGAIVICVGGIAALHKSLAHVDDIDVLISDYHLGDGFGTEAHELIVSRYPRARGILLTADATIETRIRFMENDLTFLLKPVAPADLLAIINAQIGKTAMVMRS